MQAGAFTHYLNRPPDWWLHFQFKRRSLHQSDLLYSEPPELHKQHRDIQILNANVITSATQEQQKIYKRSGSVISACKAQAPCFFRSGGGGSCRWPMRPRATTQASTFIRLRNGWFWLSCVFLGRCAASLRPRRLCFQVVNAEVIAISQGWPRCP